ncbi:TIGR02270 family protein [Pyxidicoccus sp. 3LG]
MLRQRILWDVVEEHLDEAAYLWSQRERALLSPEYVLADVAEGDEGRLRAHLEGLRIGGTPVIERLLLPALADDDWRRVAAAAHALLAMPGQVGSGPVLETLTRSEPEARRGLLRALELSACEGLDGAVSQLLLTAGPGLRSPLLRCLAFRQADTGAVLKQCFLDAAPGALIAALHAARFAPQDVAGRWVSQGLTSSHPGVRDAAIATGLVFHERAPWLLCRRLVEDGGSSSAMAMVALAMGGSSRDMESLVEALRVEESRAQAAWALGFSGRRAAAEALLQVLRGGAGGWLECESFAAITGMTLEDALAAAGEEDASEQAEEDEAVFPGPRLRPGTVRVEVVDTWWKREGTRFEKEGRYLSGKPWSVGALHEALETAPMRRRPILAWELAVRSRGACQLETRTWAREQRRQLRAARELRPGPEPRPFESFLQA